MRRQMRHGWVETVPQASLTNGDVPPARLAATGQTAEAIDKTINGQSDSASVDDGHDVTTRAFGNSAPQARD